MDKRVLLCLNKEDWFTDTDKAKLLQQITQQTKEIVQAEDILSVRSRATKRKRIRVLPDGQEIEEEVDVPLSIEPLARRMMQVIKKDGTDLLLANLLTQSRGLVEKARKEVEDSIDRQANQLVTRYMWASGGAGALTNPLPVPMVELAAGVAISTKMVMDLAKIYRQDVDLDVAVSLLGQLSKQFIGYLGVQMAAPVVAMAIGSMIKTVPGIGTVSGMLLNGIVMALVTRWIGNIFMVYFKNDMQEPEGGLAGLARREWEKVTDGEYLRKLVQVDIQGGWTKEIWHVAWEGAGYRIPGLADSEVVLIDTPGINEVGGADRGEMAQDTARQADVILFVIDSDMNETEYSALMSLANVNKPIIVVLSKIDLYSPRERERLEEILNERLAGIIPPESIVETSAQPKEVEYIIQQADGSERSEWRMPPPKVEDLKLRLLEVLEEDGLGLLALNAAMYAADKSDRVASLKVKIREHRANQTIWSFAVVKATAVAVNPAPFFDVLGGSAVDVAMLRALAHIYGIDMTWSNVEKLATSILQAAGWTITAELGTHALSSVVKTLTLGWGTVLTALPQGGAAGYGSYIVGKAAKYYFEHGASWGDEGPKTVVKRILEETDKKS
ncbi:unnamed protein product, partial [Symbiodinium sp. CCMP2456]